MLSVTLSPPANPSVPVRGVVLREITQRPDRLPLEQQVDVPEIQQASRVFFSEAVRPHAYQPSPEATRPRADEELAGQVMGRRLRTYREIAGFG